MKNPAWKSAAPVAVLLLSLAPGLCQAEPHTAGGTAGASDGVAVNEAAVNSRLETIEKRLDELGKAKKKKFLRPGKDIDFLFDAVVANEDVAITIDLAECGTGINGATIVEKFFGDHQIQYPTATKTPDGELTLQCKLAVVEYLLGMPCGCGADKGVNAQTPKSANTLKRIEAVYRELNHPDWEQDRIRFGVMVSHLPKLQGAATSVVLHAYPAYRRYMPGTFDPLRRTSFYFAVGAINSVSSVEDTRGALYSLGLGFDLTRGVALTAGYNIYDYQAAPNDEYQQGDSYSLGVSLTSDLWKGLFSE